MINRIKLQIVKSGLDPDIWTAEENPTIVATGFEHSAELLGEIVRKHNAFPALVEALEFIELEDRYNNANANSNKWYAISKEIELKYELEGPDSIDVWLCETHNAKIKNALAAAKGES